MSVIWSSYEVNFHNFFKKWSSEYGKVCILPEHYKTVVLDCTCIKYSWNLPKVEPLLMGRSDYPRSENEIWDKYEVIKWDYEVWNMK